jgi:hypothetical protein
MTTDSGGHFNIPLLNDGASFATMSSGRDKVLSSALHVVILDILLMSVPVTKKKGKLNATVDHQSETGTTIKY